MAENTFPNNVQRPLFAPASHSINLGDDIDLNEIFADYFVGEFDDMLNAYTSPMENFNDATAGAAASLAQKQQQVGAADVTSSVVLPASDSISPLQHDSALPFAAPAPAVSAAATRQENTTASNTSESATTPASVHLPSGLPTGGIKTPFHTGTERNEIGQPVPKRMKEAHDGALTVPSAPVTVSTPQMPTVSSDAAAQSVSTAAISKGAISGRLGFTMVGGQLTLPQRGVPSQSQNTDSKQAAATGVVLPVGVGIRLGGIGGVAPATARVTGRMSGVPGQFNMWGGPVAGAMSEKVVAERRQRNREHAKRSRVRKKFMLESLQEQVRQLQKENVELRMLIQEKIPQHAQQIISESCCRSPLFADPGGMKAGASGTSAKETALVKSDFSLIESLTSGQQNFVLSDPRLPDNPIVYASPGFYTLTGYTQGQVLGRNCRFLQGPGTDPRSVDIIRTAIANGSDSTTCILNYKADGTPFWNQFFVAALRDADNCIVNYVGVQCEIEPEAGSSALEDKVNSVLPLQTKDDTDDTPEG